jgi:hypothetical protein
MLLLLRGSVSLLSACMGLPITSTTMGLSDDCVGADPEVLASPAVRCSASMGCAVSMLLLCAECEQRVQEASRKWRIGTKALNQVVIALKFSCQRD